MLRILLLLLLAGCAGTPAQESQLERITREVIPHVERAAGLTFREPPVVAARSRDQVRAYIAAKLDSEYPPAFIERVATAYRLFGLMPDTLDLRALLVALLAEQVVGYYDPDSTTLYVVADADPAQLRFIVSHELAHALQGQYVPLDSMLELQGQNDRKIAFQAVMEGQATLAAVAAMFPEQQLSALPNFWRDYRQTIRQAQEQMPVFGAAPRILREGLVFPYVAGMDFMRWFNRTYPDTVPFGPRLPASTEQILHPERYRLGDEPTTLRFVRNGAPVPEHEDDLGEFETAILVWELSGSESVGNAAALGWDGDRYAVFPVGETHALVWWSVWDTEQAARKFAAVLERHLPARPGRRAVVQRDTVGMHPAVLLVDAPVGWPGLTRAPRVAVVAP